MTQLHDRGDGQADGKTAIVDVCLREWWVDASGRNWEAGAGGREGDLDRCRNYFERAEW